VSQGVRSVQGMAKATPATSVNGRRRGPTATSRFGVSRRESHDASGFYERFPTPKITDDKQVNPQAARDEIWVGDARSMDRYGNIADASVALVVTSPPYYAGKEYETAIGEGHVPASYLAYLDMLAGVFGECARKLEPGGRMAVNVANLGRKPYRSLAADVIRILEQLGLLLRGEVVWVKGRAAGGSCAWGTFQRPGNPVLRDVTERIVIASKGRFDRAQLARDRAATGLPSAASISADEFMDLTTDVWEFPSERATRVGHPAPFPVELPRRCIDLYTYQGDLVLDPFMGSGSTAVAALRTGRHYVGFDTDPAYVETAQVRVDAERLRLADEPDPRSVRVHLPGEVRTSPSEGGDANGKGGTKRTDVEDGTGSYGRTDSAQAASDAAGAGRRNGAHEADGADRTAASEADAAELGRGEADDGETVVGDAAARWRAVREGRKASDIVRLVLGQAGFSAIEARNVKVRGVAVGLRARDGKGRMWFFDVVGGFSNEQPGLRRNETLWRALGKAGALTAAHPGLRFVLFTTELPAPGSVGSKAIAAARGSSVTDVVDLLDDDDVARFQRQAQGADAPADAGASVGHRGASVGALD
jgi:DNA modification methylase